MGGAGGVRSGGAYGVRLGGGVNLPVTIHLFDGLLTGEQFLPQSLHLSVRF